MADLPDLNTGEISGIAYWNAIDQGGVSEISPDEAAGNANIIDYTAYDNGIEGVYSGISRNVNFRIKTDGWIIAYIDNTVNFGANQKGNGPWDVAPWTDHHSVAYLQQNTLESAINDLRTDMSNSQYMNYSPTDVGLYDYSITSATNITLLSENVIGGSTSAAFSYTESTNLEFAAVMAALRGGSDYGTAQSETAYFEGTEVVTHSGYGTGYGVLDPLALGLITSSSAEYQVNNSGADHGPNGDDVGTDCTHSVYIMWS